MSIFNKDYSVCDTPRLGDTFQRKNKSVLDSSDQEDNNTERRKSKLKIGFICGLEKGLGHKSSLPLEYTTDSLKNVSFYY